jgi:hypothetical protein
MALRRELRRFFVAMAGLTSLRLASHPGPEAEYSITPGVHPGAP